MFYEGTLSTHEGFTLSVFVRITERKHMPTLDPHCIRVFTYTETITSSVCQPPHVKRIYFSLAMKDIALIVFDRAASMFFPQLSRAPLRGRLEMLSCFLTKLSCSARRSTTRDG